MPVPLDLSIVVISRNADLAAHALNSIYSETRDTRYEVIVADLSGTADLEQAARQHPARPQLIRMSSESSVASATTAAARYARGRYILLLDAGTIVLNGAIDKLMAFAKANPGARIWSGRTILGDGTTSRATCAQAMTVWSLFCRAAGLTGLFPRSGVFNPEGYGGWPRTEVRSVEIVTSGFFLIERELWGGLRGFDASLGDWGQDADLCLRARAFSARPLFTPEAAILVKDSAATAASPGYTIGMLASRAALIARHWPPAMAPIGLLLLSLWPLTRAVGTTLQAIWDGKPATAVLAAHWRHVVRRRAEWSRPVWGRASTAPAPQPLNVSLVRS